MNKWMYNYTLQVALKRKTILGGSTQGHQFHIGGDGYQDVTDA